MPVLTIHSGVVFEACRIEARLWVIRVEVLELVNIVRDCERITQVSCRRVTPVVHLDLDLRLWILLRSPRPAVEVRAQHRAKGREGLKGIGRRVNAHERAAIPHPLNEALLVDPWRVDGSEENNRIVSSQVLRGDLGSVLISRGKASGRLSSAIGAGNRACEVGARRSARSCAL